jgi:hypothetical protein
MRATDDWFVGRFARCDSWYENTDVLCAADHVRVRHDVAIRIDDYSRTDFLLHAHEHAGISCIRLDWSIAGSQYLDHARRRLAHQFSDGAIELVERIEVAIAIGRLC